MRVALLTNFIPPYRKSLYTELDQEIDSLTIFVSQEMEKNRNWKVDHGNLKVIVQKGIRYQKTWKGTYGYNEKTVVQVPYDTFFKLKKFNPDIVISSELGVRSILSAIYCKTHKKPLVLWLALSEHTERNKKGFRLFIRRWILKASTTILCNGTSAAEYIKSLGIEKKMTHIPYTSDFDIKPKVPRKNNLVKTILYTGQLTERKGIKEMSVALNNWSTSNTDKKICLLVAGEGPEKAKLAQLQNLPNIEVKFLGHVPYKKLQDLYLSSNLYLFPTLADEWGVVINEAMACGLPIIGSIYSQAAEEMIADGKTGWLFDPRDQQSFLKVLTEAIDTPPETLEKMGNRSIQIIRNFTPKMVSDRIIEVLKTII